MHGLLLCRILQAVALSIFALLFSLPISIAATGDCGPDPAKPEGLFEEPAEDLPGVMKRCYRQTGGLGAEVRCAQNERMIRSSCLILDGGGNLQNSGITDARTAHCAWTVPTNGHTITLGFCQRVSPQRPKDGRPWGRKIGTKIGAKPPDHDERITVAGCMHKHRNGNFFEKTTRELMGSKEAQALGIAICTYYSGDLKDCADYIQQGAEIVNKLTRTEGSDTYGRFEAKSGYQICRAAFVSNDWSVTGATTFNASIQRTQELNALGWLVSMPDRGATGDWITTMVVIEQVPIGQSAKYGCWPTTYNQDSKGTLLSGEKFTHARAWECRGDSCSFLNAGAKIGIAFPDGDKDKKKCTNNLR